MQIYEDRSLTVTTIPLRHRMPCCGFLFAEKRRPNHIIQKMVDFTKCLKNRSESYKEWGRLRDTGGKNGFQQLVDLVLLLHPPIMLIIG